MGGSDKLIDLLEVIDDARRQLDRIPEQEIRFIREHGYLPFPVPGDPGTYRNYFMLEDLNVSKSLRGKVCIGDIAFDDMGKVFICTSVAEVEGHPFWQRVDYTREDFKCYEKLKNERETSNTGQAGS